MSDSEPSCSIYKVVTKVNVTIQIEVQPFTGDYTLDQIKKECIPQAVHIVRNMISEYQYDRPIAICGDASVVSIFIKEGNL